METLKDIRDRLKDELDMIEEDWLSDSELDKIINVAIDKAHRKILTTYEDYYLANYSQDVTADQGEIDYPSDIYANKISNVFFTNASVGVKGTRSYEIKRPVNRKSAIAYSNIDYSDNTPYWTSYIPIDSLANGKSLKLMPDNGEAGSIDIWYIRKPRLLVVDADVCDIVEFVEYVIQVCKAKYYRLDGDPRYIDEKREELELEKSMIDTLSNMVVDDNNFVLPDTSHYEDSYSDYLY